MTGILGIVQGEGKGGNAIVGNDGTEGGAVGGGVRCRVGNAAMGIYSLPLLREGDPGGRGKPGRLEGGMSLKRGE